MPRKSATRSSLTRMAPTDLLLGCSSQCHTRSEPFNAPFHSYSLRSEKQNASQQSFSLHLSPPISVGLSVPNEGTETVLKCTISLFHLKRFTHHELVFSSFSTPQAAFQRWGGILCTSEQFSHNFLLFTAHWTFFFKSHVLPLTEFPSERTQHLYSRTPFVFHKWFPITVTAGRPKVDDLSSGRYFFIVSSVSHQLQTTKRLHFPSIAP